MCSIKVKFVCLDSFFTLQPLKFYKVVSSGKLLSFGKFSSYEKGVKIDLITRETYLLTPCSRVLPEKLKRPRLLKKFVVFYGTQRFITI